MRALRLEKNLSQEGLATLCPATKDRNGKAISHDNSWISRIELDQNEPSLADLTALAVALDVDVRWLLTGEASGMTEFVARLAELEVQLDRRGRNAVLAVALQQIADRDEE